MPLYSLHSRSCIRDRSPSRTRCIAYTDGTALCDKYLRYEDSSLITKDRQYTYRKFPVASSALAAKWDQAISDVPILSLIWDAESWRMVAITKEVSEPQLQIRSGVSNHLRMFIPFLKHSIVVTWIYWVRVLYIFIIQKHNVPRAIFSNGSISCIADLNGRRKRIQKKNCSPWNLHVPEDSWQSKQRGVESLLNIRMGRVLSVHAKGCLITCGVDMVTTWHDRQCPAISKE